MTFSLRSGENGGLLYSFWWKSVILFFGKCHTFWWKVPYF